MEKRHYSLEMREDDMLTRVFQLILGVACAGIAGFWFIYDLKTHRSGFSIWVTKIFLAAFGAYMAWRGLGFGYRFIEFYEDHIKMKKNSFLSTTEITPGAVEKIEIYPLKFTVFLKDSKTILTRFGVTDTSKIELIKDEIIRFASDHNILLDIKNEL
jgi:hypothetical protein